jgi:hypothetical protein
VSLPSATLNAGQERRESCLIELVALPVKSVCTVLGIKP